MALSRPIGENGTTPFYSFQEAVPPGRSHYQPSPLFPGRPQKLSPNCVHNKSYYSYIDCLTLTLYDNGCGPYHNCTQSCQDATVIFSSMYALHNCILYPIISSIVLAGNVSQSGLDVANDFGITGHANITWEIKRIINGCMDEYCSSNNSTGHACESYYDIPIGYSNGAIIYNSTKPNNEMIQWRLRNVCSIVPFMGTNINPDIGGPGVSISYLMQSGIALAAWVMLQIFKNWTRNTTFWFLLPFGPRQAWQRARRLQQRIGTSRQRAALLSALVDFQKAQCFYMLAIQAAALVAIWRSGLGAKNWQEYFDNVRFLGLIATAGFLPVTFVLFTLHKAGMKSWYVFILSVCTVAVSGVTLGSTKVPKPTIEPLRGHQCGLNQRPALYCSNRFSTGGYSIFTFCCITIVLLLVDICNIFRLTDEAGRTLYVNGYAILQNYAEKWNPWRKKGDFIKKMSTAAFLVGFELVILFWFGVYLVRMMVLYDVIYFDMTWTFGQIVAVTIFAPSLIEYIYFVFFGIETASEYRIPKPYKVVKSDRDSSVLAHIKSNHSIGHAISEAGVHLALPQSTEISDRRQRGRLRNLIF